MSTIDSYKEFFNVKLSKLYVSTYELEKVLKIAREAPNFNVYPKEVAYLALDITLWITGLVTLIYNYSNFSFFQFIGVLLAFTIPLAVHFLWLMGGSTTYKVSPFSKKSFRQPNALLASILNYYCFIQELEDKSKEVRRTVRSLEKHKTFLAGTLPNTDKTLHILEERIASLDLVDKQLTNEVEESTKILADITDKFFQTGQSIAALAILHDVEKSFKLETDALELIALSKEINASCVKAFQALKAKELAYTKALKELGANS
jgi:hypothetical protein